MDKYNKMKRSFEANKNDKQAEQMAKYMKNKFSFYGIKTPLRRALYKDFLKDEKQNSAIDWKFLDQCYGDEHREFQYLAIDYLTAMRKMLCYDDVFIILKYIKLKQWWDTIDQFDRLIGNIGLVDSRINDLMIEWSKNDDMWLRRLAIDHQLLRKEKTNTHLLEQILLNNLESEEFFINKAIGWSLRDYSKTNPDWVRDFIKKHKAKMSSLSIKEASKYLN